MKQRRKKKTLKDDDIGTHKHKVKKKYARKQKYKEDWKDGIKIFR